MSRLEGLGWHKAMTGPQRASGRRQRLLFRVAATDDRGQTLVWVAMVMVLLIAVCAFAIDVGHAMLVRKQLQASADAAALAAATHLAEGTDAATTAATSFSAVGSQNGYGGYTVQTPTILPKCSTTVAAYGVPCTSTPFNPNMVVVTETATMNTFFAGVIGHPTMTVTATSAGAKGAKPTPYNVAIVLDTTHSMTNVDSNCVVNKVALTQLACAENAISVILNSLDPSIDNVSLFTFPGMDASTAQNDTNCSGKAATGEPYTFPSTTATKLTTPQITQGSGSSAKTINTTYQITSFLSDYRSSNTAKTLNSSSGLTSAMGQSKGCSGLVANDTQNTYLASTIYQAQAALIAEQAANPGTDNAMIILSDGNATAQYDTSSFPNDVNLQTSPGPAMKNTSDGLYPNIQGQCGQAVDAAKSATSAGTLVFSISYGSPTTSKSSSSNTGNCESDVNTGQHKNITPCQTMQQMASGWPTDTSNFFADGNDTASGQGQGCTASGGNSSVTDLDKIAQAIVTKMMAVRLISPNAP